MKNNGLTSDVLELFDRNHITANTLRKFVVESVADFLGDNKHDKVCGKLFDRWYQHVRRSIWVGAAQYVLQQHGFDHDEATNEAKQLYESLYADYASGITAGVATRKGKPMKTNGNWWTAVLSAGITAGYVTTVVQLSPGPGYMFSALRRKLTVKTENLSNSLPTWAKDYVDSLGELAYCGWCLSPWVSLPVWAMAGKINRVRFGVKWVAGWIVAAGMAAFLRHSAEMAEA